MDNPNYTFVVSVVGDCNKEYVKTLYYLNILGIRPETYDINKTWLVENSKAIMEYKHDCEKPFLKLNDITIDISEKDKVKIGGEIKSVVNNGLNIIVYDCLTKEVVDVIGFDAQNEFSTRR